MVIDVGAAVAGDFAAVQADIEAVRHAVPSATLKVIIESAALLERSGAEAVRQACRVSEAAGADFVKTSTGFHPSGERRWRPCESWQRPSATGFR